MTREESILSGEFIDLKEGGLRLVEKDHIYLCCWNDKRALFKAGEVVISAGRKTVCFVALTSVDLLGQVQFERIEHICHD